MSEKQRCFIALDLPKEMISELKEVQEQLKKQNLFTGKFTEEENIHLTLKFLGSIPAEQVTRIRSKLKQVKFNSFEANIDELGVFAEDFVRIIWTALNGKDIFELQRMVDNAAIDYFPREELFMSHITIARVKSIKDKQPLFDALKKIKVNVKGKITSFSLIRSVLTPSGSIYETIERYNLIT